MSQPAARKGDRQCCPLFDGNKPHLGGEITEGSEKVIIDNRLAATIGSACKCESRLSNTLAFGSTKVFVGGQPAVRRGDQTAHGGLVENGSDKVFFG